MYDIIKFLHLVAAIVWMGGMSFMLLALRPAAFEVLDGPVRARLMGAVWRRFFGAVLAAIAVLLATGGSLYTASPAAPLGRNLMVALGVAMVLIFGHIYLAGFRKFQQAVVAAQWPAAAQAAAQINRLVVVNFVLGWVAIGAVRLLH